MYQHSTAEGLILELGLTTITSKFVVYLFHVGAYTTVVMPYTKRRVWLMRLISFMKNDWRTDSSVFYYKHSSYCKFSTKVPIAKFGIK